MKFKIILGTSGGDHHIANVVSSKSDSFDSCNSDSSQSLRMQTVWLDAVDYADAIDYARTFVVDEIRVW